MRLEYIDESGPWTEEMSKAALSISIKIDWLLVSKPGEWPECRVSRDGKAEMISMERRDGKWIK